MGTLPSDRGYLIRSIADTTAEVINKQSHDRVLTITKGAIRGYMSQFFQTEDGNALLEVISPDAINFIVDKSFNQKDDHTKRELQIASMFEEVKNKLPSILIVDAGCKYVPPGISQHDYTNIVDGHLETVLRIVRKVPITILIAASDEETCGQLLNLCIYMFGDFRHIAGADQLLSANQEDSWVVTLPKTFDTSNLQMVSGPELQGDPKDRYWRTDITFGEDIYFEDVIKITQKLREVDVKGLMTPEPEIVIECSDEVKINTPIVITVSNFVSETMKLTLSDARLASINPDSKVLTPRAFGTLEIKVIDKVHIQTLRSDPGIDKGMPPSILATKEVHIIG